jgi:hypothetical protein
VGIYMLEGFGAAKLRKKWRAEFISTEMKSEYLSCFVLFCNASSSH